MTLSDLSNLGSFVSAIGVVASLIFVGMQLKQNTRAVRATASQAHIANWQGMLTPIIEHAEVAGIWRRGLSGMTNLTDDERVRFIIMVGGVFRYIEVARLQWLHGQLEQTHWIILSRTHTEIANQPGVRDYWAIRRSWYAADFQAWYDALPVYEANPIYGAKTGAAA
jgi:hypothetical protein